MLSFLLLYKNPYFLRLQQSIVVLSVLASSSMPNDKSISLQSPSTLPIYVDTQAVLKYIIKKNKYMLPLLSSKKRVQNIFALFFIPIHLRCLHYLRVKQEYPAVFYR